MEFRLVLFRSTTPMEHEGMGASHAGVETGAAELRAGLTSLLQEHVYLAGAAISTAVQAGGDMEAPAVVSAVDTLDANSVALSEAISSVYGEEGGAQFLELWRNHIGFFVEYTLGGATGDTAMRSEEHTSELQSLMRISYAVFCLKKTNTQLPINTAHI